MQKEIKNIDVVIIDDEPLAIEEIKTLLKDFINFRVVGEAGNIEDGIEIINKADPGLVFLDIELEGRSGFEILEKTIKPFKVVFATAYNKYAIKAFEINALDYLLKPIKPERFNTTIDRFLRNEKIKKPLTERFEMDDRFLIQKSNLFAFIKISEIIFISSDGDYSLIHLIDNNKHLLSKSINEWEEILPEKNFIRIHRGTLVNLEFIARIEKSSSNTLRLFLKNHNEPLQVSQRYSSEIKNKFRV